MSSPTSPHLHTSSPSLSSPSPSSHSSSSLPAWHFPFGPSSRYHHTERARAHHSRFKSSYVPRAPVLSTEKRAHRRAQNRSLGSAPSPPPLSECSTRSPLSRFSSYSPATMSNHMPITPAKSPRRNSSLQDSPFSDYFSDDARSSVHTAAIPASDTKSLLVRMNKLQSLLMRHQADTQREAVAIVGRKLAEMESEMDALHSQTRQSIELEDSGIFSPEEKETPKLQVNSHNREPSAHSVNSSTVFSDDEPTKEQYRAERDYLYCELQQFSSKMSYVQTELRQRQAEVREINQTHSAIIEEKDTEIEQLRSENDGLRQDLGFEYSELLFLKLQMKALEVDVSDLRDVNSKLDLVTDYKRQEKRNSILSEMDRWRTDSDWQDVEARFKRRRNKYDIPTSPIRKDSISSEANGAEIDWQLETVKEGRGRITSLTIKRVDSKRRISHTTLDENSAEAAETLDVTEQKERNVTLGGTTELPAQSMASETAAPLATYTETGTQTDSPLFSPQLQSLLSSPPLDGDQSGSLFPAFPSEAEDQELASDDYAITTSSEPDCDNVEADEEITVDSSTFAHISTPQRSAWAELWSSLSSLSGLPEDEDEDEDEEDGTES